MIFFYEKRLLLSGKAVLASVKTPNPFCSLGLHPLDPQRGAAPVA